MFLPSFSPTLGANYCKKDNIETYELLDFVRCSNDYVPCHGIFENIHFTRKLLNFSMHSQTDFLLNSENFLVINYNI